MITSDAVAFAIAEMIRQEVLGFGVELGDDYFSHVDVRVEGSTITMTFTNSEQISTVMFTATVRAPA